MWCHEAELIAQEIRNDHLREAAKRHLVAQLEDLPPRRRRDLVAPVRRTLTRWCFAVVGIGGTGSTRQRSNVWLARADRYNGMKRAARQ